MMEKLAPAAEHYEDIGARLSSPDIIGDQEQFRKLMKEYKDMTPVMEQYRAYQSTESQMAEAREMMKDSDDPELRELAETEYYDLRDRLEELEQTLTVMLLPKDPNDDKNVFVEIRGGVGGEEAALFANSLYRMYLMYAEIKRWKTEVITLNETELGGIKEIVFQIQGEGAYSRLKFESGVHRVQRVPETETAGRIHTSAVTVAVLPEAEEVEVEINPADLKVDTYRSGGAGGQHVNKTESAIRITHLPTGIIVECQDERSQIKNRAKAMGVLRSRIYEAMQQEKNAKIASQRKSQVGSGDRSERIRTYNFPQGRVSDHRISLTLYKLDAFMNGDLDEMIDALVTADQSDKLRRSVEEQAED